MGGFITLEDRIPFRISLTWSHDNDFDFSHYGTFCEAYGSSNWDAAYVYNNPKSGDFYIRNPEAWWKDDVGNGTDSWLRRGRSAAGQYGWFRLAEHPRHEVEWLMKNENLDERTAWRKVLDRWEELVQKLVNNDISAIVVTVEVFWNNESIAVESLGGIEVDCGIDTPEVVELAREHDLLGQALAEAQRYIDNVCKGAGILPAGGA